MKRSTSLVLALVLLGGAGIFITRLMLDNFALKVELASQKSTQSQVAAPKPPAADPAAAVPGSGRAIEESARQAMTDALNEEFGQDKKLWVRVDPRDREASTYAGQIASVFRDAGWEVKMLDNEGLRFKPGLLMLVADEDEPPSYVATAQKAVEAVGQDVTTGRGYLSYYEAKKKESPDWQGTKFLPEQTYVLLVGRKPDPKPEQPVE